MTPSPTDELARQAAVDSYAIVDTFAEQAYDDLARAAADTFDTPIALITFLDRDRNWFKARIGMSLAEVPRAQALCEHLLVQPGEALLVNDAAADERFRANPLVTAEPHIRFYAGAPLVSPAGQVLGAICAIDTRPREVSAAQFEALRFLAKQVIETLEARRIAAGGRADAAP